MTWSKDGTARVWHSGTGEALTPPLKHDDTVSGAAFNVNESRILTWSGDTVRLWDSATGEALTPPLKHEGEGEVITAVFNAKESRILTLSKEHTARIWEIDTPWPADKTVLKTDVETGTERMPTGELKVLSAAVWQDKKCDYDAIQHSLKRITDKQWQTSQRLCREVRERGIHPTSTNGAQ